MRAEEAETTAEEAIASLTDPKKLATLKGERAVNPRFQKCIYWMKAYEDAKVGKQVYEMGVYEMLERSIERNGLNTDSGHGRRIVGGLLINFIRAKDYGLYTSEGMNELRQGKSATITKGEYAGQEATADHYIPRAVCSELENQIINLRLCPALVNSRKGDKVEKPSLEFAKLLHRDGLLSQDGFDAVKSAYDKDNPMFNSSSYSITPPNNKYTIQPKGGDEVRADMEKDFPFPSSAPAK